MKKLKKHWFLNRNWRRRRRGSHDNASNMGQQVKEAEFEGKPAGEAQLFQDRINSNMIQIGETVSQMWMVKRKRRQQDGSGFYHNEETCKNWRIGLAAAIRSGSVNPADLYKRCNAAKPRVRSWAGCAHLATRNKRETKPESWTAKGDAENGAMTWLKSRGGL